MKILPKKLDIDKAKADQRKREIDEGLDLAKKVDTLRELASKEQKSLLEYRANYIAETKRIIEGINSEKEILDNELVGLREERKELLRPLDKEWEEINNEKNAISKEKEEIRQITEGLYQERQNIQKEKDEISQIVIKVRKNEDDTEKAKQEAVSLREMAQSDYDKAHQELLDTVAKSQKELRAIQISKETYENGIRVNGFKEKELKEKEEDLIIREKRLASQQEALQMAIKNTKI